MKMTIVILLMMIITIIMIKIINLYLGINIMPDPVRFVQLSADYWSGPDSNWTTLGYNPPPGCILVSVKSEEAR